MTRGTRRLELVAGIRTGLLKNRVPLAAAALALAAASAVAAPQNEAPLCRGDGARFALLVGNQSYTGAMQPLANPRRDVAAFGKLLCDNGFTVYRHADLDIASFDGAVGGFAAASRGARTTLVYYSGHGFAAGRQNWLAPVDAGVDCADIGDEDAADTTRLRRRLVNLDEDVLRRLDPRSDQIVVLDACRTDPVRGCKGGGGSPSLVKGFSRTPSGGGRLLVYATQDRQPALDVVEGADTSPLMTAMLRRLAADPRRDWLPAFGEVTREVASLTRNRQLSNLDVGIPPAGCLAATCEARVGSEASAEPAPDRRTVFVYSAGEFVRGEAGAWLERRTTGLPSGFSETGRTLQYIQLKDPSRDMSVRLYDDRAEWTLNTKQNWRRWPGSEGTWRKP